MYPSLDVLEVTRVQHDRLVGGVLPGAQPQPGGDQGGGQPSHHDQGSAQSSGLV